LDLRNKWINETYSRLLSFFLKLTEDFRITRRAQRHVQNMILGITPSHLSSIVVEYYSLELFACGLTACIPIGGAAVPRLKEQYVV
jgi:hypothetical protein